MAGQDPWPTRGGREREQLHAPWLLWRWALEEGVRLQRQVVQGWRDLWVETPRRRAGGPPGQDRWRRTDRWGTPR